MLKSSFSPNVSNARMAVKAVAERSLHPVARRFLFRVRCRSGRIMAMCVRYRLSSTEEEVAEFFEAELREELHHVTTSCRRSRRR